MAGGVASTAGPRMRLSSMGRADSSSIVTTHVGIGHEHFAD